jgi:hypothetical protein
LGRTSKTPHAVTIVLGRKWHPQPATIILERNWHHRATTIVLGRKWPPDDQGLHVNLEQLLEIKGERAKSKPRVLCV